MTEEEKKAKADELIAAAKAKATETAGENEGSETPKETEPEYVEIEGRKYLSKNVNKVKVHIKGLSYKPDNDKDTSNVFGFGTREKVWGCVKDDADVYTFVDGARRFPASDWGVIPTLRADMLLRNVVDDIIIMSLTNPTQFEREYAHLLDDVQISIIQIYVPAHEGFISPYTTVANPKTHTYDEDHVFTFITGFQYDINNFNHLQFIKDVYDGIPRLVDGKVQPTSKPFTISPKLFARSMNKAGYFGVIDPEDLNDFIEGISESAV